MTRKQIIYIFLIAFFVGALGSVVLGRFVVPYVGTFPHFSWLNKLVTSSPIVVNRTQEVQLNEGVNIIDLVRQAGNSAVSIYNTSASTPQFLGNGMIVTSDGLIFTSNAILQGQSQVQVVLNDGRKFAGTVRAKDPKSDLVAVTITAQNLPVVQFDSATGLEAGQRVIYISRSNSELAREFQTGFVTSTVTNNAASLSNINYSEQFTENFSTDATMPADSVGSPVIDLNGNVVGLVLSPTVTLISEDIQSALNSYLAQNKITRPSIGLKYFVFSKELAALKGLPSPGIFVASVDKSSAAQSAGLQANDLITAVNDKNFDNQSFEQMINTEPIVPLKLTVLRAGQSVTLTLTPIEK